MLRLPTDCLNVICCVAKPTTNIILLRATCKSLRGCLAIPKINQKRLVEYYISCDNLNGVKWFWQADMPLQRCLKLALRAAKVASAYTIQAWIIDTCSRAQREYILKKPIFVKTLIRDSNYIILDHIFENHDGIHIPVSRLDYCLRNHKWWCYRTFSAIAKGQHIPNYHIRGKYLMSLIYKHDYCTYRNRNSIQSILKLILVDGLASRHDHKMFINMTILYGNYDMFVIALDNFKGPLGYTNSNIFNNRGRFKQYFDQHFDRH
jgi:hypothetical protein